MTGSAGPYEHWEPHDYQAALRNEITQTRADLGNTITELAARVDVKARARQAVSQARNRARAMVRSKAQQASMRMADGARVGAVSARDAMNWMSRNWMSRRPAMVAAGAGAGALAGLGIYALVRRRLPMGMRLPFSPAGRSGGSMGLRRGAARGARRAAMHGARRAMMKGHPRRAVMKGAVMKGALTKGAMMKGRHR